MANIASITRGTRSSLSLVGGLCFVAVACEAPRDPVAPPSASAAYNAAVVVAPAGAATGAMASGRADIHGTMVQGVRDETYSFVAISDDPSPAAKGHIDLQLVRFSGEVVVISADVTCLSTADDQAWIGSSVTHFAIDGDVDPSWVGRPMILRVQDMGEGVGINDFASLAFFPPPGGDIAHCNTRPAFPVLRESGSGNIQVKAD